MIHTWVRKLDPLFNLFLESGCPLCQRSTPTPLCPTCMAQVQQCQLADPQQRWLPPLPVFAWGAYRGALKRAIAAMKYHNQPLLAQLLGQKLGYTWIASPLAKRQALVVVPIPMYADKKKQRGFDQAELLAEAFCQVARIPLARQGLVRARSTQPQFGLSVETREQNLNHAFQVGNCLLKPGKRPSVLLLDDIYTTGATARAAASALTNRSIAVYGIAAIALPEMNKPHAATHQHNLKTE